MGEALIGSTSHFLPTLESHSEGLGRSREREAGPVEGSLGDPLQTQTAAEAAGRRSLERAGTFSLQGWDLKIPGTSCCPSVSLGRGSNFSWLQQLPSTGLLLGREI